MSLKCTKISIEIAFELYLVILFLQPMRPTSPDDECDGRASV